MDEDGPQFMAQPVPMMKKMSKRTKTMIMPSTRGSMQNVQTTNEVEDVEMNTENRNSHRKMENAPKISGRKKAQVLNSNQISKAQLNNTNMNKFSSTMNHCPSSILIADETVQ